MFSGRSALHVLLIDSTSAYFDNILINSKKNYIRLDGRLSPETDDKLTLSFEGLNLSYLNNLIKKPTAGQGREFNGYDLRGHNERGHYRVRCL